MHTLESSGLRPVVIIPLLLKVIVPSADAAPVTPPAVVENRPALVAATVCRSILLERCVSVESVAFVTAP